MRDKIRPDEAEAAGCGGSTVKADNEVWPDFHRNPGVPGKQSLLGWKPSGRGHFPSFLRRSSLRYARYLSLPTPRTDKKWLPSPAVPTCRYTLGVSRKRHARSGIHLSKIPQRGFAVLVAALALAIAGCKEHGFTGYPANYREYAYVSNSGSNTVTVLDLVNMRQDRVIPVGDNPSGLAINPQRREVYVVNSGSDTVSVINARTNTVAATIRVRRQPYFIDVDAQGQRAYVANSRSNDVSVLDLGLRREIGVIGVGQAPGFARISPDGNSLVVTNRVGGSISIADPHTFKVRSTFDHCPGATDAIILPDSSKTLVACSGRTPGDGRWLWLAGETPTRRLRRIIY